MYDVIIIGGSYAGLAAALQLARARRSVLVLDAGERRNRFVHAAHGFLGHDGVDPGVIAAKGKAEVLAYPTVTWREARATGARAVADGFVVRAGDEELEAKKLILATGVVDELPEIPGIAERWGKSVFPCPYCDGYERNLGKLGVLAGGPHAAHYASLVAQWSAPGGTTLFLSDGCEPDAEHLAVLDRHRVILERQPIAKATGNIELHLRDGRQVALAALFAAPRIRVPGPFAAELGCEMESGPMGAFYKTDPETKETTVPGVYACGDAATAKALVAFAVADGVRAGVSAHQALVFR
jgi:thioredoxin reductase